MEPHGHLGIMASQTLYYCILQVSICQFGGVARSNHKILLLLKFNGFSFLIQHGG